MAVIKNKFVSLNVQSMKKLFVIILIGFVSCNHSIENKIEKSRQDSLSIISKNISDTIDNSITKTVNEMTDEITYNYNGCFMSNDNSKSIILPTFKTINNKLTFNSPIIILNYDGMRCVEEGFMIIKFTDNTKIKIYNWNDFDCEGIMYFKTEKYNKILSSKPIDKILIRNGRDYHEETYILEDSNYFINMFLAIEKYNKITRIK